MWSIVKNTLAVVSGVFFRTFMGFVAGVFWGFILGLPIGVIVDRLFGGVFGKPTFWYIYGACVTLIGLLVYGFTVFEALTKPAENKRKAIINKLVVILSALLLLIPILILLHNNMKCLSKD